MLFRSRRLWALALGLCTSSLAMAQEPPRLGFDDSQAAVFKPLSDNQQMANAIAARLKQSGQLRGYSINVTYAGGSAEVSGTVADQPQKEEALRIVQGTPGVERVLDRLLVGTGPSIQRVQVTLPPPASTNPLLGGAPTLGQGDQNPGTGAPGTGPTLGNPTPGGNTPPATGTGSGAPGGLPEPMPIFQAPPGAPNSLNPPVMPPYAWPSFAPYNNFSRVATPLAYPYNAWPYIGPVYPFPKVPLGWRSVKLEWQDGYWWFSKVANKHDWWRLRYW